MGSCFWLLKALIWWMSCKYHVFRRRSTNMLIMTQQCMSLWVSHYPLFLSSTTEWSCTCWALFLNPLIWAAPASCRASCGWAALRTYATLTVVLYGMSGNATKIAHESANRWTGESTVPGHLHYCVYERRPRILKQNREIHTKMRVVQTTFLHCKSGFRRSFPKHEISWKSCTKR